MPRPAAAALAIGVGCCLIAACGGESDPGQTDQAVALPETPVVHWPKLVLSGIPTPLTVSLSGELATRSQRYRVLVDGQLVGEGALVPQGEQSVDQAGFKASAPQTLMNLKLATGVHHCSVEVAGGTQEAKLMVLPGALSLIPPLVAIVLAIFTRKVLLSLSLGLLAGSFLTAGFHPLWALRDAVAVYLLEAVSDRDNASIVIFSLLLGSMVGVITRSGGSYALATSVTGKIRTARGGLMATWGLGLLIFFDDYVNALLVGSTMRPITDRLKVSREKLAFVVDGTSATVASLAFVSSWIGVEVGYIQAQFRSLGIERSAFGAFLESIPYRFYPILMLVFVVLVIVMARDFGPMLIAERNARNGKIPVDEPSAIPDAMKHAAASSTGKRAGWFHAAFPIVTVAAVALVTMLWTGHDAATAAGIGSPGLRDLFGHADAVTALFWAACSGSAVAALIAMGSGVLTPKETSQAWLAGVRSMLLAVTVLGLAWALGDLCRDLHTARYLVAMVGPSLPAASIPALVFVLSAAVAFATGTSWGTMAIVFPLAVPLVFGLEPDNWALLLSTISSILAGSVWGDHCSPISDTTILSAMASGCDHVEHVRTQLPYALVVGAVSVALGELAVGFGFYPAPVALLLGIGVLALLLRLIGRQPHAAPLEPGGKESS